MLDVANGRDNWITFLTPDIYNQDKDRKTALMMDAANGYVDCVKLL